MQQSGTIFPDAGHYACQSAMRILFTRPRITRFFFKRQGVPLVTTFHKFVIDEFMAPYSSLARRLHYRTDLRYCLSRAVRIADRITAVSQFTADLARRELNFDCPIEVNPNGIDTNFFRPAAKHRKDGRLCVLFSGNPSIRKGVKCLSEIARGLKDTAKIVCATGLRGGWTNDLEAAGIEILGRVPPPVALAAMRAPTKPFMKASQICVSTFSECVAS